MTGREPEYDWGRLQTVKGQTRSVSQVKEYLESLGGCAYRYFLNRVVRAWDRPAAWFPLGLGVHEAAEIWELGGRKGSVDSMVENFKRLYNEHVNRLLQDTPNVWVWFDAGPYAGQDYIDRNFMVGQEQIRKYHDYYVNKQPGEVIWITPNGEPAIELGFEFDLDGVKVKGFIDQIVEVRPPAPRTASGAKSTAKKALAEWAEQPNILRLRDIKTGANPGDTFQLKVYDLAVEDTLGVSIGQGDYFMTKTNGEPTKTYDLTNMSREQVAELFAEMDQGVRDEVFTPSPGDKCRRCGVASACAYRQE
jgi:putative RecB family exonuclease